MRIATRTLYSDLQQRLQRLTEQREAVHEKLATQKKINRPSDDPVGAIEVLGYRNALSQMEQYLRNLDSGKRWLQSGESALEHTGEAITRAKEIAVQMANDSQNAETRASGAVEVGHLLDQVIDLANTEVGGRYLFAGYRTAAAPFVKFNNGSIDTAQYIGDTHDFQIVIGNNETLTAGRNGQTVFMDSGLLDTLGALKKGLEDNDVAAIQQSLDGLDQALDHINNQTADIGARANRLDVRQGILDTLSADFKEQLSRVEDGDLAELSIELNQIQVAYQAVLLSTARVGEVSLTNYL